MFKKLFYNGPHSAANRFIAIMLCICLLFSMSNSFFSASAREAGEAKPAAPETKTSDALLFSGLTELQPTDDDPLLEEAELSAATIDLLNGAIPASDEDPNGEPGEKPAAGPPEQEPVYGDGTTIEKITIRWLSASTGADGPAGFNRLELAPSSNEVTNQQFQIDFSLSGQTDYAPGDIEIIFPAYLWLDRYGAEPGSLTLSVPEEPETGVDFVWRRVGDNIVITNAKTLPAASKVLIQGTFRDVEAWRMEDETLSSESNKHSDYSEFNATIVVTTSEGSELTMTSNSLEAYIDTSVKVTGATKTAYDSNSKKYNIYWEEVPSALPSSFLENLEGNAEDYVYIRWYISGTASGSQPFEMTVTDTVEDKYDGVMLGATNTVDGNVASTDGKTVTATIFNGYTENYRTAYIWTAYPKAQFEEGEDVEFNNTQTISVTGWDDGITTTKSASGDIKTWNPIHYKFVKIWDDDDNANGVRPDFVELDIYDTAYSYTAPSDRIFLTEEYADEEDSSHWVYEWSDEGQLGHNYFVDEKLYNYEGDHTNLFDEEGHSLHWIYVLKSTNYDPDTHTWEYVNEYDDGWVKYEISRMEKNVEAKYQNNDVDATTDAALNDLLRGNTVEIQYPVWASLSAGKAPAGYGAVPNRFVLEDGTYRLNDTAYSAEDMNIGAVILEKPVVWVYTDIDDETGRYYREALSDQTVTLYGYVNGAWEAMATITTEGAITAVDGSGATVTGRRVDLPENTEKVKTEILSDVATIVEMEYTVCLHLNPTKAIQSMVESHIKSRGNVMFPVFNQANGYVVYEGNSNANVDGNIYRPGDHLADITDMATGYVHGRQYNVAAELSKKFYITNNDVINRSVTLHSELTLTQQSNLIVLSEYENALLYGDIPNTESGTYYDLLPLHVSPDLTTIKATNGGMIESSYIIEDYKNTGRTLLVVKVNNTDNITYTTKNTHSNYETYPAKGYMNSHTIEFDSYVSWDIVQEYGIDYMRNVAAYEADEDWIGSVDGWEGEPDDPSVGNNITSGNAVGPAADLMRGLNGNRTAPSFVYAGSALDPDEIDITARTSIWKYVQANGVGKWTDGLHNNVYVEEGGKYAYQLYMKSGDNTITKDIIIVDSIENHVLDVKDENYGDTVWHGFLESIDVSEFKAAGINPVIYYSTVPNVDVSRSAMDGGNSTEAEFNVLKHLMNDTDENGNHIWSTDAPDNMSDVTAIAIDARKTADGSDFELMPDQSLTAYLHMRAPFEEDNDSPYYFKDTDGTDHMKNAHAYNDIYLDCLQIVDGDNTRDYIHNNYTKVGIHAKYMNVTKNWDDSNDADGYRPDSITVRLLANGEETGDVLVLNEENNWQGTFGRIHTYDENGEKIKYSYYEDAFENSDKYDFTYTQTELSDGHIEVTLINSRTPEQIEIPVTKTWDDEDNIFGTRADYVIVRLYADGVFTGRTLTLREDNAGNWSGSFTNLNKYRDGRQEIIYTIEEEYVDNYLSEVDGYTIKNTYHPMGDLIISKAIENTTDISAQKDFKFDLQLANKDGLPDVNKYNYTIYDRSTGNIVKSDVIGDGDEFILKGNQYIVISDIPTHVSYTVTETSAAGFTQSAVSNDSGVIIAGDNKVDFTNTYNSKGSFQLDVMKTLSGRDLLRHQFRFDLTDEDGNLIYSAYNDLDGKVSFTQINYTEADDGNEYTYFVSEYDSDMPGYDYDDSVYTIKVKVEDDGSGTMKCDVKYYKANGDPVTDIVFNNTYSAEGFLTLRLWKTIDREINSGEFSFDLFKYDEGSFEFVRNASTDETGAVVFDELSFDETDIGNTYLYLAREQKGDDETVKYSNTVLGYVVTVIDNNDGTLSFTSQAYDLSEYFEEACEECGGSGDCSTCNGFGYQAATDEIELGSAITPIIHNGLEDGSLSVTKHVTSASSILPDDEFRFKIVLIGDEVEDGEFIYTVSQVEKVEFTEPEEDEDTDNAVAAFFENIWYSIENIVSSIFYNVDDADITLSLNEEISKSGEWVNGEFEFILHGGQKATFSKIPAGTTYQIWEETTNGWMLVSQSNTSGVIRPMVESQAEFSNQYQPEIATAALLGVKYLDGKAANADGSGNVFEFVLLDQNGKAVEYVDAQTGGFITFSTLTFTEKGTYEYTIRELAGSNTDIQYDEHDEHVTIKVEEDSNGNLVANVEYDKDGIVFENITMPGALEITKLAEGLTDKNKDAEFTFKVKFYNPNGVPLDGDSFTWYVKDTETGDILGTQEAELQTISRPSNSKVLAINNPNLMPIAAEDHGGLYDASSTGVIGTVRWSLYSDGTLSFEPVSGDDGYFELANPSNWASDFPWYNYNTYYHQQIKTIESIGNIHVVGPVSYMFAYASNLTDASALASWDMSQATNIHSMFFYCESLSDASFMSEWDLSNVTNMAYLLSWTAISDVEMFRDWDLSNVISVNAMFYGCRNITDISPLADWDVSTGIDIGSLFANCSGITDISPLENWDVSKTTYLSSMFSGTGISDVSPIAGWDISQAITLSSMFSDCKNLKDVNALSGWNTSSITSMSNMFQNSGIEDLSGVAGWDTSNVTTMGYMFQNCTALTNVDGLLKWDVSKVTNMYSMFDGCTSLSNISGLSRWRVVSVSGASYSGMEHMFSNCTALSNVDDLSTWTFGDEPVNMQYMFQNSGIVNVNGILGWNGAKAGNVVYMFYGCANLADITGLVGLDVSNCTSLQETFRGCSALTSLAGIEEWDISKVTTLRYTFGYSGVSDLTPIKDWNISKVGSFAYMFYRCPNLKTLDGLENWVIRSGANSMFEGTYVEDASAIGSWTLEGISSRDSFGYLFGSNGALTTLDFTNWDGAKISNVTNMWSSNNVSKITFGENFWNGTVTSTLTVNPATPSTITTTGYWINENDEFDSNPTRYTSAELVANKVVGTYIWQYLPPYEISFTFDGDEADGSMASIKNYYHLDCVLPDNTFTRPGYIFVGWRDADGKAYYYDDDNTITIPKNTYKSGDSVTLKAIWEPLDNDGRVSYTVEYYQQSATDPEQYVSVKTLVEKAEPGDWVYVDIEDIDGFITPDVQRWYQIPANGYLTVQLYYDRVHYTIHFDGNGAEYGSMADMDMIGGVAAALPQLGFGVTSGAFLGWNTEKNGDGIWYNSGDPVNNLADDGETITLYAQWMIIDQSVDATTGEIIVSCKAGQTIVIQGLPAGITYEIEEIDLPSGWYYKGSSNESGTIPGNGVAYASVSNEYRALGSATISAHKELDGASLSSGQFEFMLTEKVSEIHKTSGYDDKGNLIEIENYTGGADTISLPGITDVHVSMKYRAYYNAPVIAYPKGNTSGDYYIWQGTYDGYSNTETIEDGNFEFDILDIDDSTEYALVLVNVYAYNTPQEKYLSSQYYAVLTYDKLIETVYNGTVDTKEQITDENDKVVDNPYYGTAPVLFDTISYTKPGEYEYYITEIDGGDDSVNYDSSKKAVKVIVTDNGDGTLSTEVIYDNKDNDEPVFKNSMKPGDLIVSKKLTNGTDASMKVDFSFRLFLQDSGGADLTGKYTVEKSDGTTQEITNGDIVKIKADEYFTVKDLPHGCQYEVVELDQPGFTLAEVQGDTGDIIGGETSSATFTNAYSANSELVLKATKLFIGGTISAGQFAFELVDQNSEHIETVYADENGNVTFSPIDFTEADVGSHFVYHIFEIYKDDDHIIYDNHTADIAVTVIDNADGTIGFEMDYDEDELVFTNVASFDLEVSKTVAGNMGNKADAFTFNMVLSNDDYELGYSVQYQKGDETGTLEITGDHYEFTLAHDETIKFIGLPVGTKYDIVETGAESYGTSVTVTESEKTRKVNGKQVSDTLNANAAVAYVNSIDGSVPTNATTLYGWVGALMITALAVLIIAKRKRAKNE